MTAKERERPLPGILATDSGHRRLRAPLPILLQGRDASDLVPAPPSAAAMPQGTRPGQDTGLPRALASGLQLASPVRIKYIERLRMP